MGDKVYSRTLRKHIMNILGTTDENSIFITSNKAFTDRMELYSVVKNTQHLIDTYEQELNEYNSEKEYNDFLTKGLNELYNDLRMRIQDVFVLKTVLGKGIQTPKRGEFSILHGTFIRVWFESPNFEAIKYYLSGIHDINDNLADYIYKITQSKFLSTMSDINIAMLENEHLINAIKQAKVDMASTIYTIISPRFINKKELYKIDEAEVYFMSTKNKSIDSLERISDHLRNNDIMNFEFVNIELITIEHSKEYEGIKIKQGLNCDCYSIIANNKLNYNRYLRNLRNEHISKYDGYFELDGKEVVYKDTL